MLLKEKYNALVYTGKEKVELQERTLIPPKEDEVTIKIRRVSICGSDLGAYRFPSERFAVPLVLGHEFSGDVAAVGKNVTKLKVGARVTANPMIPCGKCFFCKRGETNLCGNRRSMGTAIGGVRTDGAMQEYVTVKESMVILIADTVSYQAAAMLEPCGVTLACAKKGYTEDEKSVVIIGVGPIGLLILKFLKAMGVPKVICIDRMQNRLEKAKECGADLVIRADDTEAELLVKQATEGYGADRVIIAAGVGSAINQSFRFVRNGGCVVLVALMHEQVTIDPMEIVGRGLKFYGSYMFQSEMKEAAKMLADQRLHVEDLVTSVFPLEEGEKAFALLTDPQNQEIKVQLSVS